MTCFNLLFKRIILAVMRKLNGQKARVGGINGRC